MSEMQACAHLEVRYQPIKHRDGTFSPRWRCIWCRSEFLPTKLARWLFKR
jgi:hypothetical protein